LETTRQMFSREQAGNLINGFALHGWSVSYPT
jgi:hypothetical protein